MANPFDQFDTVRAPATAAPAAPLIPKAEPANPFDQFDTGPTKAAAGPKEDLLGQAGAGLATGLPNAVAGMADLMEKGTVQSAIDIWEYPGKMVDALQGKPRKGTEYKPVIGDAIRKGLSFIKANPNDYFAEPKTAGERIARMAGEGAITSILPAGPGWAKLGEIGKNLIAGTVGGAAAQGAMEVLPDEWDTLGSLAAGLGGGLTGYGVASIPEAALRGGKGAVDYMRPAVPTKGNVERLAAERLAGSATDPVAAAEAIRTAPTLVPGSEPTAFQASGDVGLGSLERALARGDDKFKAALSDRIEQQNAARVAQLEAIEETGDVGAAVQFFRDRMRALEEHADTLYDRAERAAQGQYDALGDRSAGDIGEAARTAIAGKFKGMNAEASKLWESIDPDGTMHVETQPLVESAAKVYGTMNPEEMTTLMPIEREIAEIIGNYGDTLPFQNFKQLRSAITTAMRKAKSFVEPNDQAYRRLSMLRESIEASVENSVAGRFARDASLADEFVRQAKEWYDARTKPAAAAETGNVPAASAVPRTEPGTPAAVEAPGDAGVEGSEPRPTASSSGLPQYAGAELEASSPAPIAARENYPVDEGAIQSLDPTEIGVDARRFQFKEGGDEQGVTERLQGIEKWDPRLAGTALVFRDEAGKDWVADGHQRTGLARRLMENGHPPIRINAFVLDAANGFTDAEARAIAAIKNVAEGTGSPVDAAKVMRAAKETGIELPPLPPRSALVRDGKALAELSPDAFGMVINDVVPAAYGAIVGRMVKDPLQQEEALRLISQLKPDNARQVEMVVKDMLSSGTERQTRQGGLFGEEAFASSVTLERAKIADEALKLLKQDKKLFATLVNQADSIEGSGNRLARDANETRLSTDEKASDLLTQLAFRAGPVSDELSRLARDLKAGRAPANAAARDFLGAIRRAVEEGLDTGDGAGGARARAVDEGAEEVTPRDPDTVEMFQPAPPVESQAFGRWFGKSKVTKDGEPAIVYHGTRSDITEPGANREYPYNGGVPMWFADNPRVAETFIGGGRRSEPRVGPGSNVMPVYLSIQKPFRFSNFNENLTLKQVLERAGIKDHDAQLAAVQKMEAWAKPRRDEFDKRRGETIGVPGTFGDVGWSTRRVDSAEARLADDYAKQGWRWAEDGALIQVLRDRGFDGFRAVESRRYNPNLAEGKRLNRKLDEQVESVTWAPFDPGQIKSQFNRGTFDRNSANILEQHGLDIYRDVDGVRVQFDDEAQARVFDLGRDLARLNRVNFDDAAVDALPRSVRLGAFQDEARGLMKEIGPYIDSDGPVRNIGDFARLAMQHWGSLVDEATGKGAAGAKNMEAGTLIYSEQQRDWNQKLFEGLRKEFLESQRTGKKPKVTEEQLALFQSGKPAPWREGEMFGGFDTERGLEGLPQTIIPGVKPVTDADRIGMRADKPLKGGDAPPPKGGLFDDDSREFQEKQGSLFQGGEGAIRDTMAERFAAAGRPAAEARAAGELVDSFYTTMAARLGRSVEDLVAEHPLPQVRKGSASGAQGSLFQRKGAEKNLYAVHNIKPGGVLNADKIGGLPMPSLAVTRIDKGDFSNFGDISLIGAPSLVDPKGGSGAKTYDADVYSPRYPSITHDIDDKAFNAMNRPIVEGVKKLGGNEHDGIDLNRIEDRGPNDAIESTGLKYAYLQEKGKAPKIIKKADGSPDWHANREAVDAAVRGKVRADYEDWASSKLAPLVKRERIFKGFDYNGNRRYREHNMDNVLSDMRARLKDGEGFMYGVGTIRSKHAKKFGSLAAMKKDSDRITGTDQMKEAKDEFGDRFFELADEMKPHYRFEANSFGYADDVATMFGEIAKKGMRALDEGFEDLPAELKTKVRTYLTDLANAPTEYFETKINRRVGLDEFAAALVPTGTPPRVRAALEKAGLRIVEYDKSKPNSRTEAIRKLNDEQPEESSLLFQPAYHGSPHVFDKFSSDKIGTGEGAQVYGYGLYFAGRKEVAEHYRRTLAGERISVDGKSIDDGWFATADSDARRAMEVVIGQGGDVAKAQAKLDEWAAGDKSKVWRNADAAKWLRDHANAIKVQKEGRLYKVDLPDDSDLMAWDAPLSEQSPKVKAALNTLGQKYLPPEVMIGDKTMSAWEADNGFLRAPEVASEKLRDLLIRNRGDVKATLRQFRDEMPIWVETEAQKAGLLDALEAEAGKVRLEKFDIDAGKGFEQITGKQFYDGLIDNLPKGGNRGRDVQASNLLREAGIPGHRYLDQGSRASGAGSHNYVIYDDSKVAIQGYEQNKAGPRGRIDFTPDGSVISMFEGADASTALHEAGHHFLKMYRSFVRSADAPEELVRDWRAASAWWDRNAQAVAKDAGNGVTAAEVRQALRGNSTGDRVKDQAIDKGLHEQWARGFESYLRDGKAPNSALKAIFQQFKDWLVSVYRSAAGLNVNMSPEIRKVFDRMLATEQPAAGKPRMIDEAAAGRFSAATKATREIKDVFGAKPVRGILKRPGSTMPYDMSAEGVSSQLFKAGPEGANAIKALRRAGAPTEDIEAAAVASLKRAAGADGVINPAKLSAWRAKHADALRELPQLDRRIGSASAATEAMADIGQKRKTALEQVQRSAVGRLLKIGDDGDAPAVLGRMLGRDTAVKDMRDLAREAAGDANAQSGLRRAIVDHMISRLKTPKDALRSDTFQRYLGRNAPALSQVLSPEQMQSLRAIAQDLKRASKDVRAPGGGSDTAENLAARSRYGTEPPPSLMGALLRRAAAGVIAGAPAHIVATMMAGPIGTAISSVLSAGANTILQHFRAIGIQRVDDLVREAILNPELMRALLMKAPIKKDTGSTVPLRRTLSKLVVNDLLMQVGDRERDWKGRGQRKRADDSDKLSASLGVRG